MEQFPVSVVGETLQPFIKPRNEVAAARQNLQAYLEKNLRLEDGQHLSSVNVSHPPLQATLQGPPSALSGVQRAYWKALQAHQEAQARYTALKSELQQLSQDAVSEDSGRVKDGSKAAQESYLPVLRQREKQRKLRVIERALAHVESSDQSAPVTSALDDIVRRHAGELPTPPNSHMAPMPVGSKAEDKITQLKKGVLAAKRAVDDHEPDLIGESALDSTTEPSPEATLFALQQARNELITWIESQLGLIGEAQAENDSQPASPAGNGYHDSQPVSLEEIGIMYESYLEARRKLVRTAQQPPPSHMSLNPPSPVRRRSSTGALERDKSASVATAVLPCVQELLMARQEEQALLQQTAYGRKQLSLAAADTERMVVRLANESHLVHPGALHGRNWAEAAEEAGRKTAEHVQRAVEAGEVATSTAENALVGMEELPSTLRQLASFA